MPTPSFPITAPWQGVPRGVQELRTLARLSDVDVLLPAQMSRHSDIRARHHGEFALMAAVLELAVADLRAARIASAPRAQCQTMEARDYLLANDRSWPMSAANICDTLGIDLSVLRRELIGPAVEGIDGR